MENNLSTDVFTEARLEVVLLLSAQATVALENAGFYEQLQNYSQTLQKKVEQRTAQLEEVNQELNKLVHIDGLTGLANRRCFDAYLFKTWLRLHRDNGLISVVIFDVDYFKAFNDTYGHQAGDDCLVLLAKAASAKIQRPADLIARYGGEEFIIVLPDTNTEGAQAVGVQLCKAVEDLKILHSESLVCKFVTISVGVATTSPSADIKPQSLIENADQALYRAKNQGRNQICIYS